MSKPSPKSEPLRMLPASDVAERGTICSFLLAPKEVGGLCAAARTDAECFHNPALAIIFQTLMGMWSEAKRIDVVTLTQKLANENLLEQVGGPAYVSELFTYLPTASGIEDYLQTLGEKKTLRAVATLGKEFHERAHEEQDNVGGLVEELGRRVAEAAGAGMVKDAPSLKQSLMDLMHRVEHGDPTEDLLTTGITLLDRDSPFRLGDMILIAGRRKAGKSILSITIAANVALQGKAVLYFSLEDRTPKVVTRLFAGASRVPAIRHSINAQLTNGEMDRMHQAVFKLSDCRFQIRDDVFDLAQIVAVTQQQAAKWPDLALVVVDYAQLVRAPRVKGDNREQEVASVSRTLRLMAMQMNVALLVLSQLNKDGESRESRALEMDATAMWMVDHVKDDKGKVDEEKENTHRIIAIPWQRNGEGGIGFPVSFLGHLARIENLANEN